jgi:hypothetical protein
MDNKLRKSTQQPDLRLRPASLPKSTLRGGAYEKGLHDTGNSTWLHGGDPSEKPGYDNGRAGQQKAMRKKWPC